MKLVSKRDAEGYREATLRHELVGQWHFAGLKRWALVAMVAGGTCVFGLAFILGVVARGILRGAGEFPVSVGLAFPIFLGIIAATAIMHEAVHGIGHLVFGGKLRFGVLNSLADSFPWFTQAPHGLLSLETTTFWSDLPRF